MDEHDRSKSLAMPESPDRYRTMHKRLMYVCVFFFVYLIVESFIFIPLLLERYGLQ